MKIHTRVIDKDSKTTFNFVLVCSDDDFKYGEELAPDNMEQVDVLVKINNDMFEFTKEEFMRIIKNGATQLYLEKRQVQPPSDIRVIREELDKLKFHF